MNFQFMPLRKSTPIHMSSVHLSRLDGIGYNFFQPSGESCKYTRGSNKDSSSMANGANLSKEIANKLI